MFVCCFAANKFHCQTVTDSVTDEKQTKQDWEISIRFFQFNEMHTFVCFYTCLENSLCACTCLCSCGHIQTPAPVLYSHYCHLTMLFFCYIRNKRLSSVCRVVKTPQEIIQQCYYLSLNILPYARRDYLSDQKSVDQKYILTSVFSVGQLGIARNRMHFF